MRRPCLPDTLSCLRVERASVCARAPAESAEWRRHGFHQRPRAGSNRELVHPTDALAGHHDRPCVSGAVQRR